LGLDSENLHFDENLQYIDRTRGPLNEGGLYAERQGIANHCLVEVVPLTALAGWHLPEFDDSKWAGGKPTEGISKAGVAFFRYASSPLVVFMAEA
jgi:hypothetical protein